MAFENPKDRTSGEITISPLVLGVQVFLKEKVYWPRKWEWDDIGPDGGGIIHSNHELLKNQSMTSDCSQMFRSPFLLA